MQDDVAAMLKELSARMALLRGYIAFAYPELVANPPPGLEAVFDGSIDVPAARTLTGYECLWELELRRRNNANPEDQALANEAMDEAKLDDSCGGNPLGLAVTDLMHPDLYVARMAEDLAQQLATIDWESLDAAHVAPTTWMAQRVQVFLDDGMTPAYWTALPKPAE
jgi:hypothetical protein